VIEIELFARPGCRLCDEAKEVLRSVQTTVPFHLIETNLREGTETETKYGIDIPVIHVNGLFFARHSVSAEALLTYLRGISP